MAKSNDQQNSPGLPHEDASPISSKNTPGPDATNPFSQGRRGTTGGTGDVNPSAPTIGTEGATLGPNDSSVPEGAQGSASAPPLPHESGGEANPATERCFSCADVGNSQCQWKATARTDAELIRQIEKHGREVHGLVTFDEFTRRKYRKAIRDKRAA